MASKSKKRRRALGASCILAALIIAGSSFAWFTSKDEVTNRLSASSEYGVAVAENFQPPENWVPGQEINKDASAVNTGNVDAFVRMYLDGNMRLLQQNKAATTAAQWNSTDAFGTALAGTTTVTDSNLKSMGLTELKGVNYFKTLDKTQTLNPNTNASTNAYGYGTQFSGNYSEVQAMQGSRLAYAPDGASYAFVLKEETRLPVYLSEDSGAADDVYVNVPVGTLVIVNATTPVESTITTGVFATDDTSTDVVSASGATYTSTSTVYVRDDLPVLTNIEYESFTPFDDGLYLFARNDDTALVTTPEFSGYYVTGLTKDDMDSSAGTYYALNTDTAGTNRSNYTVKGTTGTPDADAPIQVTITDGVITAVAPTINLELYTASYEAFDADALDWYTNAAKDKIYAVYNKSSDTEFTAAEDVVVEISLANVKAYTAAGDEEKWTPIGGATAGTFTGLKDDTGTAITTLYDASNLKFYYNNDVEAGDTTTKLVDQVRLYNGVTNDAYLAFDFDLNVHLDSVQVTFDQDGKEAETAVKSGEGEEWKGTAATGGATGAATLDGTEIDHLVWTATT